MIVRESARKVCEFIFCVIVLIDDEFYFSSEVRILFVDVDDRVKSGACRQDSQANGAGSSFLAPNGLSKFRNVSHNTEQTTFQSLMNDCSTKTERACSYLHGIYSHLHPCTKVPRATTLTSNDLANVWRTDESSVTRAKCPQLLSLAKSLVPPLLTTPAQVLMSSSPRFTPQLSDP